MGAAEIIVPRQTRPALRTGLPASVKLLDQPSTRRGTPRVFVLDLGTALPSLDELEGKLAKLPPVALVVFSRESPERLSSVLAALRRRIKADPFVTSSWDAVRRIVLANARGGADRLVASAELVDDRLLVWSCEPKLYECPVTAIPALARMPAESRQKVAVSDSGSRLRWDDGDVDLDLDAVRYHADPAFRAVADRQARARAKKYGKAIRGLREKAGLRQSDIPGLSDREVRRLEAGLVQPHAGTVEKLARAHGLEIAVYLGSLSQKAR